MTHAQTREVSSQMRKRNVHRIVLSAAVATLACTSATGPQPGDTITRPATLHHYGDGPGLSMPESTTVNAPLSVQFTTYGGGCVQRAYNEVQVIGLAAVVRSYQREYIPRDFEGCTDELRVERNTVTVTFRVAGTARVRVVGRQMPGAQPLILERVVQVNP